MTGSQQLLSPSLSSKADYRKLQTVLGLVLMVFGNKWLIINPEILTAQHEGSLFSPGNGFQSPNSAQGNTTAVCGLCFERGIERGSLPLGKGYLSINCERDLGPQKESSRIIYLAAFKNKRKEI